MGYEAPQSKSSSGKMPRVVTRFTHIRTLLWKNWMLKKRHPYATLLEVLLPVLFIILLSALKGLTSNVDVPAGFSETSGGSYTMTDPIEIDTSNLGVSFGRNIPQARYVTAEPTMSGLLMHLGMRYASDINGVEALDGADKTDCVNAIAFLGNMVNDTTVVNSSSLPWAIPSTCKDLTAPYKLAVAPNNAFTRKYFFEMMKKWYPQTPASTSDIRVQGVTSKVLIPSFEDSVRFFETDAALEDYITGSEYGKSWTNPKIYGAIVFDQFPDDSSIGKYSSIEYSIRLNSTQSSRTNLGSSPRTIGTPFESPFKRTIDMQYNNIYSRLGFMTLQTAVTRFVNCMPHWDATTQSTNGSCQHETATTTSAFDTKLYESIQNDIFLLTALPRAFKNDIQHAKIELNLTDKETLLRPLRIAPQSYFGTTVAAFPIEKFVSAPFYDSVKNVFAIVFVLSYLYAISRVLVVLIQEKETRSREYMKILGVQDGSIILSWYITYIIIFLIGSIIQALASSGGLFASSDGGIIFLFFFLFSMSVLSFGFLISTLFSRARTGAFAGMILFFFMYFVSSGFSDSASIGSKAGGCLLAPVALSFGVQALATMESTGVGMNFGNASTVNDNFSFNVALWMLFIDSILYTLLGLYFERVIPKEYGTTEKWYFPLSPSFWCAKRTQKVNDVTQGVEEAAIDISPNIEKVGQELLQQERTGEALVLHNIKKEFAVPGGIKRAVKGVSMSMYKDQITCLLGHNGAGKTTLISMLTGIISPSDGDAYFHGLSLTQNMSQIRQSLGLCFQHDVLYAELSVEEHLLFYARIKGYNGAELNEVVSTKIKEVGLTEKRKVFSGSLSGGMKRKLSVAICLLGDSSLVFLDEPTSGMDPYSRRSTWEILLNNRQNRVVVLTTHFMDEADILGDRIAIMAEGELRCCGSSLFLKNRYGAGYNFTLVKKENCQEKQLIEFVTTRISNAKILSNVGAETSFQLPLDCTAQFATMFEALDEKLEQLGVLSYGISVTTLEEVFIKVAEAGDEDHQHTLKKDVVSSDDRPTPVAKGPSIANLNGWMMFFAHLSALLMKRFRVAKRDRRVMLFSAILPVTLLAAGLGLLKSSSLTSSDVKLPLTSDKFISGTSMSVPYYCENDDSNWCSHTMESLFVGGETKSFTASEMSQYSMATPTVFNVTYPTSQLDVNGSTGYCLRLSEKVYQRAFGKTDADMTKTTVKSVESQYGGYLVHGSAKDKVFGYHLFVNSTATHGSVIFKALLDQALYRLMAVGGDTSATTNVTLKVNTFPLPYTAATKALFGSFLSFTACIFIVIAFAFFPASIVVFLVKEKQAEHNSKHQQLVSGVSLPAFWLANFIWDMITYGIPFIAAIVLIKGFDISAFTGTDCTTCTSATFPAVVLLFFLFGLAICPFTYCMSYLFKEHASSQTYTIIANFILGVILMVVSFILDVIGSSQAANKVLKFFWRLSPLFNLGSGLLNLSLQEITGSYTVDPNNKPSPFDMDVMGWSLLYLAFDAVFFISVAVGIDFLLSFPKIKAAVFKDPVLVDDPYEEDEDVKREAERVQSGGADNDAVKLQQIRKIYKGNKIAVRNLSFGLPKGECFGYLGINGAGKTTTMKMLTGDIIPTSGQGTLGGFDILSQQIEIRRLIGYCPQFDALFELLSVREHLELFAQIKGVFSHELDAVVKDLMHQMNLDDFEHKLAGTLSGGNKRKLSVAIAMIGSPPIIFLDEPSTGMDPVSRRFMWNVIADISTTKKESTIILTTHSMEECEALCTRVGIMVGGRMRCLGSVQHLKHRFGNGLMTEMKLEQAPTSAVEIRLAECFGASASGAMITKDAIRANCEKMGDASWADKIAMSHSTGYALAAALERDGSIRLSAFCAWWIAEERYLGLNKFLQDCFGAANVQVLERQNDMCRYKLMGELRLSKVFKLVEAGKAANHIREYSVSQTTLEQIFNYFASQQSEEKGVARGMMN
uniref:ABC transporter domain-containing protein n=1 Tax=Globisporangium ultimum (strain ATCC 200006 / CBS 805.95 / DAOM BR144) TaxID=431595 RepID=K3W614_GLOUD